MGPAGVGSSWGGAWQDWRGQEAMGQDWGVPAGLLFHSCQKTHSSALGKVLLAALLLMWLLQVQQKAQAVAFRILKIVLTGHVYT